jgi:hypothetical protein
MMEPGTRVALARDQQWTGTTHGREVSGKVHVRFDRGGSGTLPVDALVVLPDEDKRWPPVMETKTR